MSWCAGVGRGESWAGGRENREKGTQTRWILSGLGIVLRDPCRA